MTKKITVYEKPTCTTCRKLTKLFIENGIDFEKVNYYIDPLSESKLKTLIKKTGLRPFKLLRGKGSDLTETTPDNVVIKAMVADPDLLQRPIVEVGDRAVLARPVEKALELIRAD